MAAALATMLAACGPRAAVPPVVLSPASASPMSPAGTPADTVRPALPPTGAGDRRFLIMSVDDSTVTMLAPRERWVRRGMYGIAVDPRRRDALVARLYVLTRVADTTVALVTGQTTRMSTEYVAIFRRPETPVLRQRSFWGGLAAGAAAGAAAALLCLRGR